MKKLTAEGHAKPPVQAEPLTQDMEEKLWERKVFGSHSGQALLYTVFFYVSKCFGLRSLTDGSFVFWRGRRGTIRCRRRICRGRVEKLPRRSGSAKRQS